jgi:hypothetical protein
MHYTEIALIALIVIIAYMRPRMISGVVRTSLGKLALVVAVLLISRYTNRNSGILAAIAAISLIHIAHQGIEGMDVNPDAQVPPPLTDDDKLSADVMPPVQEDKSKEKLSKMDLECISRALRSCSSNEMPVNRDAVGATSQAPEGTIATAGKGTETFYA